MAAKKRNGKNKSGDSDVRSEVIVTRNPELDIDVVRLRLFERSILVTNCAKGVDDELLDARNIVGRKKPPPKGNQANRPPVDPRKKYMNARYRIDRNTDGFPACAIKTSLVDTAKTFEPSLSKVMIRGAVFVRAPYCGEWLVPIECDPFPPVMRQDRVALDSRGKKVPDIRWRPEYRNWSIPIEVEFEKNMVDLSTLFNLFRRAGYHVGIGENRPGSKQARVPGQWGRFDVMFEDEWKKNNPFKKRRSTKRR